MATVSEAEVDWGEAQVLLRRRPTKAYVFRVRACHPGAAFVMAFPRQSPAGFLEGHV